MVKMLTILFITLYFLGAGFVSADLDAANPHSPQYKIPPYKVKEAIFCFRGQLYELSENIHAGHSSVQLLQTKLDCPHDPVDDKENITHG